MGSQQDAHKLITVSLEKIALSRRKRSEMSLHKNLLVTTVIHKARLAIIEEDQYYYNHNNNNNNNIVQYDRSDESSGSLNECYDYRQQYEECEEDDSDHEMSEPDRGYLVEDMDEETRMEWSENHQTFYTQLNVMQEDKENLSPSTNSNSNEDSIAMRGMKRARSLSSEEIYNNYYAAKRLKTWDPNEIGLCNLDQEDSTSHTLRLVSVLSATLSKPCATPVTSFSWPSTDLCSKQAKDANAEPLFVNRPVMAIAV